MLAKMAAVEAQANGTTARFRGAWLFSARTDLLAFLGPALLAFALLGVARVLGLRSTPTWAWIGCVVLVDVAHVHATVFRVYLDRSEVARRPFLYLGTPLVAYAIGATLHLLGGAQLFWRVLAYFAVWHFVRQQAGWVALYRGRFGERADPSRRVDAFLDTAAIYVATLHPLLVWHTRLPRKFSWFVEGDFLRGLPSFVANVSRPIWLALLVLFVARQVQLALASRAINLMKVVVVLTTFATWWVGIVLCESDYAFTVTNVLPHGIPYFVLVAAYSRKRYGDRTAPPAKIASALVQGGFTFALLALFVIALIEEGVWDRFVWHDHETLFGIGNVLGPRALGFLVPLLALPQAVHYALDGAVWKRTKNPGLARYL